MPVKWQRMAAGNLLNATVAETLRPGMYVLRIFSNEGVLNVPVSHTSP